MDRNSNMSNLEVDMEIDLRTGRTRRWAIETEAICKPPPDVMAKGPVPDCDAGEVQAVPARTSFPFGFREGLIMDATDKVIGRHAVLRNYEDGPVSPSGRWIVLNGEVVESDYMHRGILLFDRSDGSVHQVPKKATPVWPQPINFSNRRKRLAVLDTVLEDDIRWLPMTDADVLVLNDRVMLPGVRMFEVKAEVAR